MDSDQILADIEKSFGNPRGRWSKEQWRKAAETLAKLTSRALGVAHDTLEAAKRAYEAQEAKRHSGLGLASMGHPPRESIDPAKVPGAATIDAAMHRTPSERRLASADSRLRALLADPFGKEAYLRLTRDSSPAARKLLERRRGALPAVKGSLAAKTVLEDAQPSKGKPGRPRKQPEAEPARWLRLFELHSKQSGLPVKTTEWVRRVLEKSGTDVRSLKGKREVERFARAIIEERKRRKRQLGN